ncbi:MAG: ORF6N domain-containing protein [Chthoniobacteraceae bacterium]
MKSDDTPAIVPRIFAFRGESVMLDSDLAILYGVETKQFNRAIQRNAKRFPSDFAFQLTRQEFTNLRCQIGTSSSPGGRRYLPWVFTEHGAIMAATILSSERAVAMSVYVVRAFVKIRRELLADATLEARLQKIEKTLLSHDSALRDVIQKLRPLLLPLPDPPKPRIGFHREEENSRR